MLLLNSREVLCFRMFENRGQHMIDNDYTPCSALDIFVKDLVRNSLLIALFPLLFSWDIGGHCGFAPSLCSGKQKNKKT